MPDKRKQKLIALGSETLADVLLGLEIFSSEVGDMIERLIATPRENEQRFKQQLSSLQHSNRFVDWKESYGFAQELQMMLQDLEAGVDDPLTGMELVATFYEADETILEMCDDSSGSIGDVFLHDAGDLFVYYASRCPDKQKVADIILNLSLTDSYGVRNSLMDCAGECLPEEVIRTMIDDLQKRSDTEEGQYDKRCQLRMIETLARQVKDAPLFEKTRIAPQEKLSADALVDIARVYLESGDIETAHSWLKKIPEGEVNRAYGQNELLEEIYRKQGDSENLMELLFRKFRYHHSNETLQALLDVIGHDKRDDVVNDEVRQILKSDRLDISGVEFMIAVGKMDKAAGYLLKRADQIDGYSYYSLLPIAEAMESDNWQLAASLIYRSLIASILGRGYSKAYHHGIRYLEKLDELSVTITDWKDFDHHETFKEQIVEAHGRKRSFWARYEVKK